MVKQKKTKRTNNLQKLKVDMTSLNTTDIDEIERRKMRAELETFHLEDLESQYSHFGTFCVHTNQNKKYTIEIRSLHNNLNSCNCIDFRGNGLGTCKHIEYVLKTLKKKGIRAFSKATITGSERIEIYLNSLNDNAISILWPKTVTLNTKNIIDPFFSIDGTLLGNIEPTYDNLCRTIRENHISSQQVRISQHIDYFIQYQKINSAKETLKSLFMQDVNLGKRNLNVVKTELLPYQKEGMLHLAFTERAILADEMGLGKTVQAIAACELLKQTKHIQRVLVVTTASLKSEWEEQITKFTNSPSMIIYGTRASRLRQYKQQTFFYLMNYEQVVSDYEEIQKILAPDVVILDEAQRIKNWQTKTASKIKEISSRYAFVLTGTPIENRIDDIYSLVQFLDPHVFGPLFRFYRNFYTFDENGKPIGYKNLNQMYHKLRPIMLCRRKIDVENELPQRTINNFFVAMAPEQRKRYDENDYQVAIILARARNRTLRKEELEKLQRLLACMRMICDTPFILDTECRIAPKIDELKIILDEILTDNTAKIIIFSEWARMLQLVQEMLEAQSIGIALHTGSVNQKKRREEINRFKNDPQCKIFLSTDAGSVGLNLQVANVVINLDLPWNPAKLEQRIARAWRKNQMRQVQVINLVCEDSIEHRMIYLLEQKQKIATAVLTDDINLDEMKSPSGRAAFMERVESLMTTTLPKNVKTLEAVNLPQEIEKTKHSIVQQINTNLELLNTYQLHPEDKPVIFAVVNEDSTSNLTNLKEQVQPSEFDNISLEMIDKKTFELIQRLAKAGILTLNSPVAELYDKNSKITKVNLQKEQINKANHFIDNAIRKHKVANVLIQSDFDIEAIPPLREAFTNSFKALCHLVGKGNTDIEQTTAEFIDNLIQNHDASDKIASLFNEIIINKNEKLINVKNIYSNHDVVINSITNIREKFLNQLNT